MQWSYCSFALSHQYYLFFSCYHEESEIGSKWSVICSVKSTASAHIHVSEGLLLGHNTSRYMPPECWQRHHISNDRSMQRKASSVRNTMPDIKNNAWVTPNNDFLSRVRWFGKDFHEWWSHKWKSLQNHLTSDEKSLFTELNVSFYFFHAISCHEHINQLNTIFKHSFRHCCQVRSFLTCIVTSPQLICDVRQMRDIGIVTSYSLIVIALANWHEGDLH